MFAAPSSFSSSFRYSISLTFALGIFVGVTTGCGSSNSTVTKLAGNTNLTVVMTSTANDQVTNFNMQFQTLTLTSQSGKSVTLFSSPQPSEFMHLNGNIEPLTSGSIPQDIYTSASVTLGGAEFVCISQDPSGGLLISHYSVVNQSPVVNLDSPITVTGNSMTLSLDLLVSSSAILPSCYSDPIFSGYSMSPTFRLTPLTVSSSATNAGNGLVTGLDATINSVGTNGSKLTLTLPADSSGTRTVLAHAGSATVFQGVSSFAGLTAGTFVNMDGAVQSDGSLLATRIEVENPAAINLFTGPVMAVFALEPVFMLYGRTEIGPLLTDPVNNQPGMYFETPDFDLSNATFHISGQFSNLGSLPFVPSFDASNLASGQNVDVTSPTYTLAGGVGPYTPATTITLIPQTINGSVEGVSTSGSFTVYSVSLADYDLFPQLAVQPGQTTILNNPSQVQVYVDSNTQKLNTESLSTGSTLRFYGLVFNDNGTLRMDCAQVSDGPTTSASGNATGSVQAGRMRTQIRPGMNGLPRIIDRSLGLN
jgi:Domain of unknown function (DUF5666)